MKERFERTEGYRRRRWEKTERRAMMDPDMILKLSECNVNTARDAGKE